MTKSDVKKAFYIACIYIGAVLGAGFASGQEIMHFFVSFGVYGIWGVALMGVLFALAGWGVLHIVKVNNFKSYKEFIEFLLGKRLGGVVELVVGVFLFIVFVTMHSAGGAAFSQAFLMPRIYGTVIIAVLCFVTLLFDLNGVVKINTIITPLLVVGTIVLGVYASFFADTSPSVNTDDFRRIGGNFALYALVYVSYNCITAFSVLASMGKLSISKKSAKWGGIAGGLALGVLGLCIAVPLLLNYGQVRLLEIPMLALVDGNFYVKYIYFTILLLAIFTTAIVNGFAIVEWLHRKLGVSKITIKIALAVLAVAFSQIGFSRFVGTVYPLFGYIGLFELAALGAFFVFGRKRRKPRFKN